MTDVPPVDRDELVAGALRDLPVPDHGPAFWADLEAALGDRAAPAPPRSGPPTGELPSITALADRPSRRNQAPVLAGVAAAAVLLVAVGLVLLGGDGGGSNGTEAAQEPEVTTDAVSTDETDDTTARATTPPTTAAAAEAAPAAVTDWLEALGSGEVAAAAALTGPRSAAYIHALDPTSTVEAYLTESQDAFGGWATSDDREIATSTIGPLDFDGGTLHVVTVTGTYPGEDGTRVDVFPVVDDGEGFKVEWLAFSPDRDNDPVFTVPRETATGLGDVGPDVEINVFVPADGTVWFSIDGAPADSDTTSTVADEPFALHNPPGELAPGEHQLVLVAIGDDGTIAHYGGTFEVAA